MSKVGSLFLTDNRIDRFLEILFVLLAFFSCLSEHLCRNIFRLIILLLLFKIYYQRGVLERLKDLRGFVITAGLWFGVLFFSSIYGGQFKEVATTWTFKHQFDLLLAFAVCLGIEEESLLKRLLWLILLSALPSGVYIVWQTLANGFFINARPVSLIGHWMVTATMYISVFAVMLYFGLEVADNSFKKGLLAVSWVSAVFGLGIVAARGGWIAVLSEFCGLLLIYGHKLKKLLAVLMVSCFLIGGVFAFQPALGQRWLTVQSGQDFALNQRFYMWQSAINMWKDHPLFGVGMGNYTEQYQSRYRLPQATEPKIEHAHNMYLHMLAEFGVVGLSVFVIFWGYQLYWSWQRRRSIYGRMLFWATVGILVYSVCDHIIFWGYAAMRLYWLLTGICWCGWLMQKEEKERA